MNLLFRATQVVTCALLVAGFSPASYGALELRMFPDLVTAPAPGAVDVDFVIRWDGVGNNLISSIVFDLSMPAQLTLPDNLTLPDPLGFTANNNGDAVVRGNSVTLARITGNVVLQEGNNLLTTLTFQASSFGDFPVGVVLFEAARDEPLSDISSQFVAVTGGTISVVPEPSSLALLGLVSIGGFCSRRRR